MRPIFVGGAQRSGTTMLGSILGGHSEVLCIPEATCIVEYHKIGKNNIHKAWELISRNNHFNRHWEMSVTEIAQITKSISDDFTYRQLIEEMIRVYSKRGADRLLKYWVCHTPHNIYYSDILLDIFDDARFIHIYRDGRAVCNSIIKSSVGPKTIYFAAKRWSKDVSASFMAQVVSDKPELYLSVRYENVLTEPTRFVTEICNFLDLVFEKQMLENKGFTPSKHNSEIQKMIGRPLDPNRIAIWKSELNESDIALIQKTAANVLRLLGYKDIEAEYKFTIWMKLKTVLTEHFKKTNKKTAT